MSEKDAAKKLIKAERFFAKARKASNFDYAIDMYLEGLRCRPDGLEEGHMELRELALLRQVKGGKKPSMVEKVRYMRGKTALARMLNAEYLLAKDPDNLQYAEVILNAAELGGYTKTAQWIADLLFQANSASEKPSFQTYMLLKDSYETIGKLGRAVVACEFAMRLKPDDKDLHREHQRLSAELTVSKGKYDIEGDFRQSIKDRESQEKLQSQEAVIKSEEYTIAAVEDARKALAQNPEQEQNIFNLAYALSDLQTDEAENEAVELLENTYKTKKDFSFKRQAGLIRMRHLRHRKREAKEALESNPDDMLAKVKIEELSAQLKSFELEHYRLCVENHPTDLHAKYEYGIRLLKDKQYNEAIPLFQEAQKDPRHRVPAMSKTGLCFFEKGWLADAIDIFNNAINLYELKDDALGKELRYNLARAYEQDGQAEKALEIYRKIAQTDFAYKDVRERVNKLRG